jgi:hypothetical protein
MTSDRGVLSVVLICGINSGVKVEPLPVEVEVAVVVVATVVTPIASGENSEIPVTCPVVTGMLLVGHTQTSMRLVVGLKMQSEITLLEPLPGRICMILVLMPPAASKVAGEQVLLAVN